MTLGKLGIEEVDNPNFFSAIELKDRAQVKLCYVCSSEKVRWRLLEMLLLKVKMLPAETSVEKLVEALVLSLMLRTLPLLVLTNALCTLLVKHSSLIWITQHVVRIGHILKSVFRAFWVLWIFVGMIFDCEFFKSLLNVISRSVSSQPHNLIVVLPKG